MMGMKNVREVSSKTLMAVFFSVIIKLNLNFNDIIKHSINITVLDSGRFHKLLKSIKPI